MAATRLQVLDWVNQPERWFRDAREVLRDTIRVLADLVEAVDVPNVHAAPLRGDSTGQFGIQLDAILDEPTRDDRVGDLAFIAAGQLRRKLGVLEEAHRAFEADASGKRLAHLADALGSSVRHVLRATCIVEPELARVRGLSPRLSLEAERARSLAVRRAYTAFRRTVQGASYDREGLLAAQQGLRALFLDVAYRDARPSDRAQIEALRDRVDAAIASQASPSHLTHLITDLASFASMLRVVSRREVLVTHDHEVLPQIVAQVGELIASGRPVLRGHLDAIRGIDDDIEALLEPGLAIDGVRLLALLERAHQDRQADLGGGFA